jgi:hypothetical protein
MVFKHIAAVLLWLLVTLTSAFGFMASELKIASSDFFYETVDPAEQNELGTRDTCWENGWLSYDTTSGYCVATNKGVNFVGSGSGRGSQLLGGSKTGAIISGSDGAMKKALSRLSKRSGSNQGDLSKRFHQIKKRGETPGANQRNQLDDITGDVFDGNGNYSGNVFDDF